MARVRADECELRFTKSDVGLTRLMRNAVHQATDCRTRTLQVRVIVSGRVGTCTTDRLDQDTVSAAIERAFAHAVAQPESGAPARLPGPFSVADSRGWSEITARTTAYDRAQIALSVAHVGRSEDVEFSGALTTAKETFCVLSSRGTEAYQQRTWAGMTLVGERGGFSGWADWTGRDISQLPAAGLAGEAVGLAQAQGPAHVIEPGPMTVVLDHDAVGKLVGFLGALGFGARSFIEGRSFLAQKLGERIAPPFVSLFDDPTDPDAICSAFDHEGAPRRRVALIDGGVASGMVTDSITAPIVELPNTGNGVSPEEEMGPIPAHLAMRGGESSLPELIRRTRRGVYVRRFHYVNPVDERLVVLTGMTRDGCFLIENGRLGPPLRNLRFTQSVLALLRQITDMSAETRLVVGPLGPIRVPAIKARGFAFTGVSEQ